MSGVRQFVHPDTGYYLEFPPGPLALGETIVRDSDVPTLSTEWARREGVDERLIDRLRKRSDSH